MAVLFILAVVLGSFAIGVALTEVAPNRTRRGYRYIRSVIKVLATFWWIGIFLLFIIAGAWELAVLFFAFLGVGYGLSDASLSDYLRNPIKEVF